MARFSVSSKHVELKGNGRKILVSRELMPFRQSGKPSMTTYNVSRTFCEFKEQSNQDQ